MAIRVHLEEVLKKKGMTQKNYVHLWNHRANLSILRSGKAKVFVSAPSTGFATFLVVMWEIFLKFDGNLEEKDDE